MRTRLPLAVVATLAVALTACSSDPGPPPVDRGAEISQARTALGPSAAAVGTAATTLATRAESLAEDPREAAVAAVREAGVELEEALEEAQRVDVSSDVADVQAAVDAHARAVEEGFALVEAGRGLASAAEALLATSTELEAIRAGWDEPGSFSQQLERFDELQAEADGLADRAAGLDLDGCDGVATDLASAAASAAEATTELRDLVASRSGTAFDQLRAELDADPYGLGVTGLPQPLTDFACPVVDVVGDHTAALVAALGDLESALNPEDLSTSGATGDD